MSMSSDSDIENCLASMETADPRTPPKHSENPAACDLCDEFLTAATKSKYCAHGFKHLHKDCYDKVHVFDRHISTKPDLKKRLHALRVSRPDKYKQLYPWLGKRQTVAGMLTCLDEGIGNVTKAMAQAGYDETNSVIIFTAEYVFISSSSSLLLAPAFTHSSLLSLCSLSLALGPALSAMVAQGRARTGRSR